MLTNIRFKYVDVRIITLSVFMCDLEGSVDPAMLCYVCLPDDIDMIVAKRVLFESLHTTIPRRKKLKSNEKCFDTVRNTDSLRFMLSNKSRSFSGESRYTET